MNISRIFITNFRNIKKLEVSLDAKTLITGLNGTGKTSLIEVCYTLLNGRSFRTSDMKECIRKGCDNFFIKSEVLDFQEYGRELSIGFDFGGNRKILVDGMNSSRKGLMNIVYSVLHSPENMDIISGGPKNRRDFIDRICFMENRDYFDDMIEYYRFVKQKNSALKKNSRKTVEYLNSAAIPLIEKIREKRKKACEMINGSILLTKDEFFPQGIIELSPYVEEKTGEKLSSKLEKELVKGFSLYGPHLDPLNIQTNTGTSKNSISMGETYLLSFLLKLSEIAVYAKKNIYPVFFIDDVFVFLDENTKKKLYEKLIGLKNQVIMTSSSETGTGFSEITSFDIEHI